MEAIQNKQNNNKKVFVCSNIYLFPTNNFEPFSFQKTLQKPTGGILTFTKQIETLVFKLF
jgi:hypothetical protein